MLDDTGVGSQKLRIIEWQHLDLLKFYPMALTTSCAVRAVLYPLSVVKARLQLQKQNNVYSGMRHAFADIIRNEGMVALFRGFWVTLPQLGVSFIYSTIYEKLRNDLHTNTNIQSARVVSALAGGFSTFFTQIIFVPTDVISYFSVEYFKPLPLATFPLRFSQHMMIYNNPSKFLGSAQNVAVLDFVRTDGKAGHLSFGLRVVRAIYHVDGIRGFYRGFVSSLLLYTPSSMVFWYTYYDFLSRLKHLRDEWKSNWKNSDQKTSLNCRGDSENLLLLQTISGALGGICAAVLTNPLEVLRVRIQVHRTNYWETIRRLYRFEGFRVFSKGLMPRVLSSGINSCLLLTGYEVIKRLCVLPEFRDAIVW